MNFINLRNVANQEINESFSGILRISPNIEGDVKLDDPTPLLYSIGKKLKLSDSAGNYLNIDFVPKIFETYVAGYTSKVNLINITQEIDNLYCTTELHITPTLYINLDKNLAKKAPIQIVNDNGVLLFPIEAPIDDQYINYHNRLSSTLEGIHTDNIQKILDKLPATHEIYTSSDYEDYHVKVNGKKIYRLKPANIDVDETTDTMVPEIYLHDYVLGQSAGHTYKSTQDELNGLDKNSRLSLLPQKIREKIKNSASARTTQLSFIKIEKLIWSLLEGSTQGSYRSFDGRYKNLYPGMSVNSGIDGSSLFNELFKIKGSQVDDDTLENLIRKNAPLLGVPVQSGLIMYNAMPIRRFLFHTLRRYENLSDLTDTISIKSDEELFKKADTDTEEESRNLKRKEFITLSNIDKSASPMHNLTTEYVLCDGKRIKAFNENNEIISDYPSINKNANNWALWGGINASETNNIYDALAYSMGSADENALRTPRLFELNQLSLRYLRGLNWQRKADYNRIIEENNTNDEINTEPATEYYNHNTMLIEKDGTFIISDWFNTGPGAEHPKVENNKVDYVIGENTLKYCLPNLPIDDKANVVKNIKDVGVYYANYDYHVADTHRHVHQIAVNKNLLKNRDTLNEVREYYNGTKNTYTYDKLPQGGNLNEVIGLLDKISKISERWANYVKLEEDSYLGSYVMRSVQGIKDIDKKLIKEIQNLPIVNQGGSSSGMRKVNSGYKGARRNSPRCHGNYHKSYTFYATDGGYRFAAYRPSGDNEGWRFLSSLPKGMNKYGSYKDTNELAKASFNNNTINIDDSLPNPPAINLIPLMKI